MFLEKLWRDGRWDLEVVNFRLDLKWALVRVVRVRVLR